MGFLQILLIATLPATISGVLAYLAARNQSKTQINSIKEQNKADIQKLVEEHKVNIEALKEKHKMEIKMKEKEHAHQIELMNIQYENEVKKDEQIAMNKVVGDMMGDMFGSLFSGNGIIGQQIEKEITKAFNKED